MLLPDERIRSDSVKVIPVFWPKRSQPEEVAFQNGLQIKDLAHTAGCILSCAVLNIAAADSRVSIEAMALLRLEQTTALLERIAEAQALQNRGILPALSPCPTKKRRA
jgi:hypothetical protein